MSYREAVTHHGEGHTKWMLKRGRWQSPRRGVVVLHPARLTPDEQVLADLVSCGSSAVLGGLTAAHLDGFSGFPTSVTHIVVPEGLKRAGRDGIVVHRSRHLSELDVHPHRRPARTRIARSIVDAASWVATELGATAIVAAAVQQGLVRPSDLRAVLARNTKQPRRALLLEVVAATDGGSLSEHEIEFLRLCRRYDLPRPSRQVRRADSTGRMRYTDAEFDEYGVVAEVDGAQHMELATWWDDLDRQNDLVIDHGRTVIRFVGLALRMRHRLVVTRLHDCLRAKRPDLHDGNNCKVCRLVALGRL